MAEREQLVFEAVTRQASQEIRDLARTYRGSLGSISDDALKLASAQYKVDQALSRHGPASNAARNAELQFRKALQETTIAAQREAGVLDQAAAAKSRFGNAGLYAGRGVQQLKGSVVGATAGFLGTTGLIFALQAGIRSSIEFDRSMRNVNSIAKLSEEDFGSLSNEVLRLSNSTGKGPVNLANGLYDIVSSGFQAKDALVILSASAKAASAGMTDTAVSGKAVVGVLNAYHLGADQARRTSDLLFQEVNIGINTFEELGQNIGDVVPQAAALKIPLEEILAAIATITKGGTNAPEAFTQLSRVLTAIIKPSKDLQAEFDKMGFRSGQAAVAALGFSGVLARLSKDAGGNQQVLAKWLGEVRGIRGVINLTGENLAVYIKQLKAMETATEGSGATQKAFEEQQKSLGFQLDRATGNVTAAGTAVEQIFNPALVGLAESAGDAAGALTLLLTAATGLGHAQIPEIHIPFVIDIDSGSLFDLAGEWKKWFGQDAPKNWASWIGGILEAGVDDAIDEINKQLPPKFRLPRGSEDDKPDRPGGAAGKSGAGTGAGAGSGGSGGGPTSRTQTDYQIDLETADTDKERLRLLRQHRGYLDRRIAALEADKTLTDKQKDRLLKLIRERKSTQGEIDQINRSANEAAKKARDARDKAQLDAEQEAERSSPRLAAIKQRQEAAAKTLPAKDDLAAAAAEVRFWEERRAKMSKASAAYKHVTEQLAEARARLTQARTVAGIEATSPWLRAIRKRQAAAAETDGRDDDTSAALAEVSFWKKRAARLDKTSAMYETVATALAQANARLAEARGKVSAADSGGSGSDGPELPRSKRIQQLRAALTPDTDDDARRAREEQAYWEKELKKAKGDPEKTERILEKLVQAKQAVASFGAGELPKSLRQRQLRAALTDTQDDDVLVAKAIEGYWRKRLSRLKETSAIYEDTLRQVVAAHDAVTALTGQLSGSGPGSAAAAQADFLAKMQEILRQYAPNYGTYGMGQPGAGMSSAQAYQTVDHLGQQTNYLKVIAEKGGVPDYAYGALSSTF